MMVLAIAWTIFIFIGCSLPGKDLPPLNVFDQFDKIIHFTCFFVFAFLWLPVFPESPEQSTRVGGKWWLLIILLSFAYGFALEFYQINFVIGRSWDFWDGIADGVGGIMGSIAFIFFNIRTKSK